MSNTLAIAAVTLTMRHVITQGLTLDPGLAGAAVTMLPPDKARDGVTTNQINLFLYQATVNAALRNMDPPRQVKSGESGYPPLPLDLYYLITGYGQDNRDELSQRLLGCAARALLDYPVLKPADIAAALAGNDLANQIEHVRITVQPLSLEEISKLWMIFQTQYRLSLAYQASVVLIDSRRQASTPLPVLTRGITVQPNLAPPFPTLTAVTPPQQRPSALLGDTLTFDGVHLDGDSVVIRFNHPLFPAPRELPALAGGTATRATVALPNAPADPNAPDQWPAGVYTVSLVIKRAGHDDRVTNALPITLAPRLAPPLPPPPVQPDATGAATIKLSCSPKVWPGQRVSLLLGDRDVEAQPHSTLTGNLTFIVVDAISGDYTIRLRVDGVDTLSVVDYTANPPVFDPTQKVTIT